MPDEPLVVHPTVRGYAIQKEEGCEGVHGFRKFYKLGNVFVKRSLRPPEFTRRFGTDFIVEPGWQYNDQLRNEAACLRFVRENTDIPVPNVVCVFEDDQSVYLITEVVSGVSMDTLPEDKRRFVEKQLIKHYHTMWSLKSKSIGGPTGIVILPSRVHDFLKEYGGRDKFVDLLKDEFGDTKFRHSDKAEFGFCHNDYSQQNIMVDPETLQIAGILDWEYSGFFPRWFDRPWFKRYGPAAAIGSERDDKEDILSFFRTWKAALHGEVPTHIIPVDRAPWDVKRESMQEVGERLGYRWQPVVQEEATNNGRRVQADPAGQKLDDGDVAVCLDGDAVAETERNRHGDGQDGEDGTEGRKGESPEPGIGNT